MRNENRERAETKMLTQFEESLLTQGNSSKIIDMF